MRNSIIILLLAILAVVIGSMVYNAQAPQTPQIVNATLEAGQIILPDGHPEFPHTTAWVVVKGPNGPIEVPIPLSIPKSWAGKYSVRVDGNAAYYDYLGNPDMAAPVFWITAMTESQWQDIQAEPHGDLLFTYGSIVYIYNPALENLYSGAQADEFSRMVGEAVDIANTLVGYFEAELSELTTYPVLQAYFDALAGGQYDEAVHMFGGDLALLTEYNPDINSQDRSALFEAACTVNGFQCSLQIKDVVQVTALSPDTYRYLLEFQTPDGTLFELGPCAETPPGACLLVTQFTYTVQLVDNQFKVMELPVLGP